MQAASCKPQATGCCENGRAFFYVQLRASSRELRVECGLQVASLKLQAVVRTGGDSFMFIFALRVARFELNAKPQATGVAPKRFLAFLARTSKLAAPGFFKKKRMSFEHPLNISWAEITSCLLLSSEQLSQRQLSSRQQPVQQRLQQERRQRLQQQVSQHVELLQLRS
jgi:hypothetical protein